MNTGSLSRLLAYELHKVSVASWLLKLFSIPVGIATAQLMSKVVAGATNGAVSTVITTVCGVLALVVCAKALEAFASLAWKKAKSKALHRCKLILYGRLLMSPMSFLYQTDHGEALESLNDDFQTITDKSVSLYPEFWAGIFTAAAYFLFLLRQSPWIAACLAGFSLLQMIPPLIVKRFLQVNYDNCREIEAEITDQVVEGYEGFVTIKLYHLKDWWLSRMAAIHKRYLKIGNRSEATLAAEKSMYKLLDNILKYGTYGAVGLFVLLRYSTMGTAVEAIALSPGLFEAVKGVFSAITKFAVAKTAEARMRKWDAEIHTGASALQNTEIKLTDLSFQYEGKQILNHVSCRIDGSQFNLIKGANGIGKSTLSSLITGMLRSTGGDITIGGIKPEEMSEAAYVRQVLYLPQDDAKFDFPPCELYEMLPSDRQHQMKQIAEMFGLTELQLARQKIRDLSGGERKKVFLSMAFAIDPPILLLDEPTNSLDEAGKKILCRLLKKRRGGAVVISHEDIFDKYAGRIFVMENGGIADAKERESVEEGNLCRLP